MRATGRGSAVAEAGTRTSPALLYGLLFALAAALSAATILRGINPHDEGLMLQAAARIADGQLPYRDFWWNYGPAQPLLLGGLDALLGPSLLWWRIVRVLLDATVAVSAYALARRDAPAPLALAAWLAAACAMAFPSLPSPNPAIVALGLGAILLAPRSPLGAGLVAGLAVAFRIDAGAAAVAGALVAAAGYAAPARRAQAAGRAAAGAALGALLSLGPFVLAGGPARFWDQTLGFALEDQSLQRLPLRWDYPGALVDNKLLEFYVPHLLLLGAALWLGVALFARPPLRLWAPAPLAATGVAYLLARVDEFHLIPLAAALPVLLAVAAQGERAAGRRVTAAALVVVLGLVVLHGLDRKAVQLLRGPELSALDVDVADGARTEPGEARALAALTGAVRARVPEGEPIFVANPRHDLVKLGNPLVYVLTGRPNPTRYDVMQPGIVTSAPVQREMVRDLERARPELVVRWLDPVAEEREPNGAGRSSGVRILDRFLAANYREERRFGDYALLAPRTG